MNSTPQPETNYRRMGLDSTVGRAARRIQEVRELARQIGLWNCCLYALNSKSRRFLGRDLLHKYYLFAQPVPTRPLVPEHRGAQLKVEVMSRDQILTSVAHRPHPILKARLDQGSVCLGVFREDCLIGYLWYVRGTYREDEVRCDFHPTPTDRTAWDYDVFLDPASRGTFAYARLWDGAFAHMRAQGICWSLSRISAFNIGSVTAQKRMRAIRVGSLLFFIVGKLQVMFSSQRPFLHVSLNPCSRPVVWVPAPRSPGATDTARGG